MATSPENPSADVIAARQQYAEQLRAQVVSMKETTNKSLQIGSAVVVALFGASLAKGFFWLLLVAPLLYGLLVAYQLQVFADMILTAAILEKVHAALNEDLKSKVFVYDPLWRSRHGAANASLQLSAALYWIIFLASVSAGFYGLARENAAWWIYIVYGLSLALTIATMYFAFLEQDVGGQRVAKLTSYPDTPYPEIMKTIVPDTKMFHSLSLVLLASLNKVNGLNRPRPESTNANHTEGGVNLPTSSGTGATDSGAAARSRGSRVKRWRT